MSGHSEHQKHGVSLKWATAKHALRCLIGCNIGEGTGAALGYLFVWDIFLTMAVAVTLAFIIGYLFTMIPMLKSMSLKQAAKVTVIGDTASIAAMETIENGLTFVIPGFMHSGPTESLFWLGLGIILPAGYAVAYPTMYWAMKREKAKSVDN